MKIEAMEQRKTEVSDVTPHKFVSKAEWLVARKIDPEARKNFAAAEAKRIIVREDRTFVKAVDGTFDVSTAPGGAK
jgi:hypothetical protein